MIYLNDDIAHFSFEDALPLLSEQRKAQALRFRHEQGRKLCAMAYLLLCEGLRKEYGIDELPEFGYGPYGKPFIVGHTDIHFNLSHCQEGAICVLSDRPVGVDIESLDAYQANLVKHTMNFRERVRIRCAARPDIEFVRLWTMKEAVLKCSGVGLIDDLKPVLNGPLELITKDGPGNRYAYSVCYGSVQLQPDMKP